MDLIPIIEVRGKKAPLFMATLLSCLRAELSSISLKAVNFETERLFMRIRNVIAMSGECAALLSDCVNCEWEVRSRDNILARIKIFNTPDLDDVSIFVPSDSELESKLRRLLKNPHDSMVKTTDGLYQVAPLYAQSIREIIADCFPNIDPSDNSSKVCASSVNDEVMKVSFGAKFCLFMFIFFVPLMCLLWKIYKDKLF